MAAPRRAEQIAAFLSFAQDLCDRQQLADLAGYPNLLADPEYRAANRKILSVEYGRRYAKVVETIPHSRSVYCFLDLDNGDILKAEGWLKPAKHARGSLDDPGRWPEAVTAYGGVYLR